MYVIYMLAYEYMATVLSSVVALEGKLLSCKCQPTALAICFTFYMRMYAGLYAVAWNILCVNGLTPRCPSPR